METPVRVCIVTASGPAWADALHREAEGDTVVRTPSGAVPWREHYGKTDPYAQGLARYEQSALIRLPGSHSLGGGEWSEPEELSFAKHPWGLMKITPDEPFPGALERVGSYDGVPLFGEVGTARPPEVYFIPGGPGCAFQPYMKEILY